jgi:hypothetical protein
LEKEDDMMKIAKEITRELKTRWITSKPGMEEVMDKVMGWTDANSDLRIHLLGWLAVRTDEQIQQEAVEMVDSGHHQHHDPDGGGHHD